MDDALTIGGLIRKLEMDGHLDAEGAARAVARAHAFEAEKPTPWYLKAMVALGAWIAGIFFLGFVGCTGFFTHSNETRALGGALFVVWAVAIRRFLGRYEFAVHFALALSVAAHGLLIWAAIEATPNNVDNAEWRAAALVALGLCALLYPIYRDAVHRFLTCLLVAGLAAGWAIESEIPLALHEIAGSEAIGLCVLFTSPFVRGGRHSVALEPLGYALAVALPFTVLLLIGVTADTGTPLWPTSATLAATLFYLVGWAGGWGAWMRREPAWWTLAVIVLLAAVSAPGLLAALALLVLGRELDDYPLQGIGIAFLPVFLVVFYSLMEIDLLTKSAILAASGAILLAARYFAARRPWAREEAK